MKLKLSIDKCCVFVAVSLFHVKFALFAVFLLILETDFKAHKCVGFSASGSFIEQLCPPLK